MPEELADELRAADLTVEALVAIEGPAWIAEWLGRDPARDGTLLEAVRTVESEPTLLGASLHLLAVGQKR